MVEGVFGTGKGEVYTGKNNQKGTYLPVWIEIGERSSIDVRPRELGVKIQKFQK